MKNKTVFLMFFLLPFLLVAQEKNTSNILRQLPMTIAVPSQSAYLTSQQLQNLGKKTKLIMAKNGLGGSSSQQFILYPEFEILQEQTAESLMGTITVIEAEVIFTIKQLGSDIIFNSEAITVTGDGSTKKQAINAAINQIKPGYANHAMQNFIVNAKTRIKSYYDEQCQTILDDAVQMIDAKQYLNAIGLLSSIPAEVNCHTKARELQLDAFLLYQEQNCSEWLLKAKASEAGNHYSEALSLLSKIDPLSSCGSEAEIMLKRIGKAVDNRDRQLWEAMERRYSDQVALEEMRMEMVQNVLTAYYQSQQSDFHQYIFIR